MERHSFEEVLAAATHAGLDETLLYQPSSRNAFLRAARKLVRSKAVCKESVLADKYTDDLETIKFQFSERFLKAQGVEYTGVVTLIYNKSGGTIACPNPGIEKIASNYFQDAKTKLNSADILRFVSRCVVKKKYRQVSLRDGVYALPGEAKEFVSQLEIFFSGLGAAFFRLEAGSGGGAHQQTLLMQAVGGDIRQRVEHLKSELAQLVEKGENGKPKFSCGVTERVLENRRKQLAGDLTSYTKWARSLGAELSGILAFADDAGRVFGQLTMKTREDLIREIQAGEETDPLVLAMATSVSGERVAKDIFTGQEDTVAFIPSTGASRREVHFEVGDEG
jgi:hypothetical protein